MQFTYLSYRNLVNLLLENGYEITDYHNHKQKSKNVILRHDIDYDLDKAVIMSGIEYEMGVKSTYFVLLTSDFYNVFSKNSIERLKEIIKNGHELGLHFDEEKYLGCDIESMCRYILNEAQILQNAVNTKINVVSMHRPSRRSLDADLQIPGMVNSYGYKFFHDYKYLSDSRRRWREPVNEIIKNGGAGNLHILTHPFWYFEEEQDLHDTINCFVNSANRKRYGFLNENITDLENIMDLGEVK